MLVVAIPGASLVKNKKSVGPVAISVRRLTYFRVIEMCLTGFEHSDGYASILTETVGQT